MEELYVLSKDGKFYSEVSNSFTVAKENEATKYEISDAFKKKKKLEKKIFGSISVKRVK